MSAEYNHSIPGALKNALDYLYKEWNDKAVAFAAYGSVGGARAVQHLRDVAGELQLADVRAQLSFTFVGDFENLSTFKPGDNQARSAQTMFDQLERWAGALKPLRG